MLDVEVQHAMAHGLNTVVLKRNSLGTSKVDGGTSSGNKTGGIGSRRIFAPQFKLQVLDSYRNDVDCKGNQRATARKYGIHRRQIQKWLQVETNLRNSVLKIKHSSINETISKQPRSDSDFEARKCGPEMAFSYHRQRDDTSPVAYTAQSTHHDPVAPQITHSQDPLHMANIIGPASEQRVPFIPGSPIASVCTSPEAHRVPCVIIHTPPPQPPQQSPSLTPLYPPNVTTPDQQQKNNSSIKTEEIKDQYNNKIDQSNLKSHTFIYPIKDDRETLDYAHTDEPYLYEMTMPQFPYYSPQKSSISDEPIDLSLKKSDRDLFLNQSYTFSPCDYDLHTPAIIKSQHSSSSSHTPPYYNSTQFTSPLGGGTPSLIDLSNSNYQRSGLDLSNDAEYEIWDLSTKSLKRKYEEEDKIESKTGDCVKKPVKLFKPYLDDDDYSSSNSSSPSRNAHIDSVDSEPKFECYVHSDFYHNNNNNKLIVDQTVQNLSPYYVPFNSNSYSYYESYERLNCHRVDHFDSGASCVTHSEDDATISATAGAIIKQRQSYSLNFKLSAIECYYKDAICRGNQRAVANKYKIHRRQVQKWLKQEHELRERIQTHPHNQNFMMNNQMHVAAS